MFDFILAKPVTKQALDSLFEKFPNLKQSIFKKWPTI